MRRLRTAVAALLVATWSMGADCGPLPDGGTWAPETLALSQNSFNEVVLSLTDANGPAACASAGTSATLSNARQLLVNLGTEPFELQSTLAATVTEKQWDAAGVVSSTSDTSGTYRVSTASCTAGCLIEVEVPIDGANHLLLVELQGAPYPRCLDAGEFTFGPL